MSILTLKSILAALLIAAARCGLVLGFAALAGWPRGMFVVPYSHWLLVCIAVATFLVAFSIWRPFVAGRPSGLKRGAIAGLATGFASHPVTWMLFFVTEPSMTPETGPFQRLGVGLLYSWLTFFFIGPLTAVATTLAGAVLGYLMEASRPQAPLFRSGEPGHR